MFPIVEYDMQFFWIPSNKYHHAFQAKINIIIANYRKLISPLNIIKKEEEKIIAN